MCFSRLYDKVNLGQLHENRVVKLIDLVNLSHVILLRLKSNDNYISYSDLKRKKSY